MRNIALSNLLIKTRKSERGEGETGARDAGAEPQKLNRSSPLRLTDMMDSSLYVFLCILRDDLTRDSGCNFCKLTVTFVQLLVDMICVMHETSKSGMGVSL